jgi:hypothetical protein
LDLLGSRTAIQSNPPTLLRQIEAKKLIDFSNERHLEDLFELSSALAHNPHLKTYTCWSVFSHGRNGS